ncbi:hypothetical protein KUCAC02_026299 [Chaenocephalus aceratus]|uniref:Uncharacterized protein n=1 Tax=Chaenocephalus aceratus TaxID=36190 RepID=A0ACB9VWR8_CHAAC|nr:hypothetical protein KUCAC02_026299 [Chaenocephalus aceratus]
MDTTNANAGGASAILIASSAQAESNGKILEAIHSLRADVTTRNDEILAAISEIKTDLSSYSGRLTQAEDRIGETEDNVTVLHTTVNGMEKVITALTEKVDDLENRDRRSNLRVIGLPENAEEPAPVADRILLEYKGSDLQPEELRLQLQNGRKGKLFIMLCAFHQQ